MIALVRSVSLRSMSATLQLRVSCHQGHKQGIGARRHPKGVRRAHVVGTLRLESTELRTQDIAPAVEDAGCNRV
jgi:hypothetical protein